MIVVTLNTGVDGQAKIFLSWISSSTLFPIIIGHGGRKRKESFRKMLTNISKPTQEWQATQTDKALYGDGVILVSSSPGLTANINFESIPIK